MAQITTKLRRLLSEITNAERHALDVRNLPTSDVDAAKAAARKSA